MASILYNIIISPIEFVVEVVFELMWRLVGQRQTNQGLAVIGVSLAISLLTLPLYRRADAVQQKERDIQARLARWVNHIRKTFKGDERFMMLQTYYRENGYNPLFALNGSISLLLEIPFFIAAYHFLSHLEVLKGASFGLVSDLGMPDGLLKFGGYSLNLLPILMTAINCVSAAVYLKGFPLKDKIQTYGMALVFLVLLYNSPSGLVVYWTCNNIFSLVKNVFYRLKNPKRFFVILCAVLGTVVAVGLVFANVLNSRKKIMAVLIFQYIVLLPLFYYLYESANESKQNCVSFFNIKSSEGIKVFVFAAAILALLSGFVVPLNVIVASPNEFIVNNESPLNYIFISFSKSIGLCFAWPLCIRILMKDEKQIVLMDAIFVCMAFVALLDVFLFPMRAGLVSIFLKYENEQMLSLSEIGIKKLLANILSIAALVALFIFLLRKNLVRLIKLICLVITITLAVFGGYNINIIQKSFNTYKETLLKSNSTNAGIEPIFHFSKTGKNVFVVMLDRAAGAYLPYIFNEKKELYDEYEGFKYYPNTISFSLYTLAGAPPLYGGYEYVPVLQNNDSKKSLLKKREEAISLLPRIFAKSGFSAVMTNMPWIGETETSDFFFMDNYPEKITSLFTSHKYREVWIERQNNSLISKSSIESLNRNFVRNGIVCIFPYFIRKVFYDNGNYLHTTIAKSFMESKNFEGDAWALLNDYSELDCLPEACDTSSLQDSFVFMQNPMPHHPRYLQYPDYTIEQDIVLDENNPLSKDPSYHVNAASLILLGKWLQWLKENDVYDNTKIIISADHGSSSVKCDSNLPECQCFPSGGEQPLLLVKDFNSRGKLIVDDKFMTNADVPSLAVKDCINNPVNPATGKDITEISLKAPAILTLADWKETKHKYGDVDTPSKFVIDNNSWWSISGSIFDKQNWKNIAQDLAEKETWEQIEK